MTMAEYLAISVLSNVNAMVGLIVKILLSKEEQTKLYLHFLIIVKVIFLTMTIMIFKIQGITHGSKQKNILPFTGNPGGK
jgi:hypothetical protein